MPVAPGIGVILAAITTRLREIDAVTTAGGLRGLVLGGNAILEELRIILSQPHSGPVYGGNSPNPASLPGEPPALQQGDLRGSYRLFPAGQNAILLGSTVPYSRYLEFGTSRMLARPHLRPTAEAGVPTMVEFVVREIRRQQEYAVKAMRVPAA